VSLRYATNDKKDLSVSQQRRIKTVKLCPVDVDAKLHVMLQTVVSPIKLQ